MTDIWKRRLDAARFIIQYGDDEIRQHVKDNTDEDWMIRRVAENDMPDSGKLNHGAPGETGTLISRLEALEKAEEIMHTAEEERMSPEQAEDILRTPGGYRPTLRDLLFLPKTSPKVRAFWEEYDNIKEKRESKTRYVPFVWYTDEPPRVDGLLVCVDEGDCKRNVRWSEESDCWFIEAPEMSRRVLYNLQSWKRWMIIEE